MAARRQPARRVCKDARTPTPAARRVVEQDAHVSDWYAGNVSWLFLMPELQRVQPEVCPASIEQIRM